MGNTIAKEASSTFPPHSLVAGIPILVTENNGIHSFWRVPVMETMTAQRRHVGFFDLAEDLSSRGRYVLLRYGLPPIEAARKAAYAPRSLTELRPDEIAKEASAKSGKESVCQGDPSLVYLGFE